MVLNRVTSPQMRDQKNRLCTQTNCFLFQSLSIEVETVCDCPCEYPGNPGFEADSEACSGGNGDNACGVCFCHENFSGDACECDDKAQVGSNGESNGQKQFCRLDALKNL